MTVTDFDADVPVPPQPASPRRALLTGDRLMVAAGITLACAAAIFPWYVFFHEEQFGVRLAEWGRTRDLPEGRGHDVFSVSPLAMVDRDNGGAVQPETGASVDPLVTATVSSVGKERPGTNAAEPEQPFPGQSGFRLLHVANGRALIEDGSGMYMVRVGSILPDNSKVATLEMRDGKWVIVTSKGAIYQND